ncbi:MAG: hypothetical protein M1813_008510 [Trichoglossum hirsutum]|nr:MAG: hypothetical protein M1813_008510 [Trichoglossum hirsutum]
MDISQHKPGMQFDSHGASAVAVSISFATIAAFTVAVRLVTRWRIVNNLGADDLVISASMLVSIAMSYLICDQVRHGLGRHSWSLTEQEYKAWLKRLWINIPLYNLTLTLTKISILLQYLRVFPGRPIRRACYILFAIVIVTGIWTIGTGILTCVPIAYNWDHSIKGGRCLPLKPLWFANATLNIVTDLSILVVPMPVLKSLVLPKKQKIGLFIVFALGGFVCITSIVRLHSIYIASTSHDETWDNVGAAAWSCVEANTGIICAALPTIRPLLARLFPRLIQTSFTQSRSGTAGSAPGRYRGSNIHGLRTTVGTSDKTRESQALPHREGAITVAVAVTQEVMKEDGSETDSERALVFRV